MLGWTDRSIPVLFPKLFADRLIAHAEGDDGVAQPLSIPDLMEHYVVDQNRNVASEISLSDEIVDQCVRVVAWDVCAEYRPCSRNGTMSWRLSSPGPLRRPLWTTWSTRLVFSGADRSGRVRFGLDTLAEYLAAQECVEADGSDPERWRIFLREADAAANACPPGQLWSFLYAVWDGCCRRVRRDRHGFDGGPPTGTRPPTRARPSRHGDRQIARGTTRHLCRRIENLKFRNLIEQLSAKVVLILGRFTPERKAVLDDIWVEGLPLGYTPVIFDFDKPSHLDRIRP